MFPVPLTSILLSLVVTNVALQTLSTSGRPQMAVLVSLATSVLGGCVMFPLILWTPFIRPIVIDMDTLHVFERGSFIVIDIVTAATVAVSAVAAAPVLSRTVQFLCCQSNTTSVCIDVCSCVFSLCCAVAVSGVLTGLATSVLGV